MHFKHGFIILLIPLLLMTKYVMSQDYRYSALLECKYQSGSWKWPTTGQELSNTYSRWADGHPANPPIEGSFIIFSEFKEFKYVDVPADAKIPNVICEAVPTDGQCPAGYGYSGILDTCHKKLIRISVPVTWAEAVASCEAAGGYVANIETEHEFNYLRNWMMSAVPVTDPPTTTQEKATTKGQEETTAEVTTSTPVTTTTTTISSPTTTTSTSTTTTMTPITKTTTTPKPTATTTSTRPPTTQKTTSTTKKINETTIKLTTRTTTMYPDIDSRPKPESQDVSFTEADKRPSAIGIGVSGIIMVIIFLILVCLMDLHNLKRDILYLRRNLKYRNVCKSDKNNDTMVFSLTSKS